MAAIASSLVHRRSSMIQRKNVVKDSEKTKAYMEFANAQDVHLKNTYLIFTEDSSQNKEDTIDNVSYIEESEHFLMNFIPFNKRQNKTISKLKISIKTIESFIGLLSLISILGTQFEYEFNYKKVYYPCTPNVFQNNSYSGDILRIANTILCIILSILNIIVAGLKYQLEREQKIVTKIGFVYSFYSKMMIFDVILCLMHPVPYVEFCFEINTGIPLNYNLQTFFYAINLLKIYFVLRTLLTYSQYTSPLAEKFCNQTGCEAGPVFAGKCLQADYPLVFIAVILCTTVLIFGLLLRMFELPNDNNSKDYEFFANGFWNVIVTMTTVGYGDFTPKTVPGQVIVCISILFGTLMTSLIIVGLTSASSFSSEENRAFLILHRLKLREELMHTCQKIIKLNFYLKQRRSVDSLSVLLMECDYNKALRNHQELVKTKVRLLRDLTQDSFVTQESRLISLDQQIKNSINIILTSLKILCKQKTVIQIQLDEQKKLGIQLVQIAKIIHEFIKPLLYNTLKKRNTSNDTISLENNYHNGTTTNNDNDNSIDSMACRDMKKLKKNEKKLQIRDLSNVLFSQSYTKPIITEKINSLFLNIISKNIDSYKKNDYSYDQSSYELRKEEIKSILALENKTLAKICEYTPDTINQLYNLMKIYSINTNLLAQELASCNDFYNQERVNDWFRNDNNNKVIKRKKTVRDGIIQQEKKEVFSDSSSYDSSVESSIKKDLNNPTFTYKINDSDKKKKAYNLKRKNKEKKRKEKDKGNNEKNDDNIDKSEHIVIDTNNDNIIINNNSISHTLDSDLLNSPRNSIKNASPVIN